MTCSTLFGAFLLAASLAVCSAFNATLQADNPAVGFDAGRKIPRSNAGNKVNLLMKNGDILNISFCVIFEDTFQLLQVNFSNDGTADEFTFTLDDVELGNVATEDNPNEGFNWDVVNQSGTVGGLVDLQPGEHMLRVALASANPSENDGYGAEIDSIVLEFQARENGDLSCPETSTTTTEGTTTEGSTTTESTTTESSTTTEDSSSTSGDEESTAGTTDTFSTTDEIFSSSASPCEGDYC